MLNMNITITQNTTKMLLTFSKVSEIFQDLFTELKLKKIKHYQNVMQLNGAISEFFMSGFIG
jgi:hypothetical protein